MPKSKGKFDDEEYNYVVLAHTLRDNGIIIKHKMVNPEEVIPL